MAGFGNIVQKAFYLGVGAASLAAEKAGSTVHELREQAQTLADEMVQKGEMNAEEAKKLVNDMVKQAQQQIPLKKNSPGSAEEPLKEPRQIEIIDDDEIDTTINPDEPNEAMDEAQRLRKEVESLQEELKNLRS